MTNTHTPGAHRPENVTGPAPVFTEPPTHRRSGGHSAGNAVRAQSWRDQADAIRADLEARAILRSLRSRGAGA